MANAGRTQDNNEGCMMKYVIRIVIFAIIGVFTSVGVYAATDGTTGTTSSGTTVVTLNIPDLVSITKLSDMTLAEYGGTGNWEPSSTACIYRNGTATYDVTVSGNKTGGFLVSTGAGGTAAQDIVFTATWDDGDGADAITHGVVKADAANANTTSLSCGGGTNATLAIVITEAAIFAKVPGAYTATLTVLIEP